MKTPEKIKKGLECYVRIYAGVCPPNCLTNECDLYTGNYSTTENVSDAIKYIQQLEAQVPKWISVEERLPEPESEVLVWLRHIPNIAIYGHDKYGNLEFYFIDECGYRCAFRPAVTHWMPLPEGPKEG